MITKWRQWSNEWHNSVNTGWRMLVITCYHSVQTHHKHQAALCQLQPQPRGPVKGRFQTFAEALA